MKGENICYCSGNLRSLPIAPSLVFSFHQSKEGSKELSGEIISAIRSNGQSVENKDLYEVRKERRISLSIYSILDGRSS